MDKGIKLLLQLFCKFIMIDKCLSILLDGVMEIKKYDIWDKKNTLDEINSMLDTAEDGKTWKHHNRNYSKWNWPKRKLNTLNAESIIELWNFKQPNIQREMGQKKYLKKLMARKFSKSDENYNLIRSKKLNNPQEQKPRRKLHQGRS